jgi:hypothetical protein
MGKPLTRGRPSPRDERLSHLASERYYMLSMDPTDPRRAAAQARVDKLEAAIPPKRERVMRPVDGRPVYPLEKEVLADALKALRNDPRVWIVDRRQSGVFQDGDRYIRVGTRGVLDISGMLKGGKYFELEAKRQGEKPEPHQLERIAEVREGGGISGYFWSVETCLALLPS